MKKPHVLNRPMFNTGGTSAYGRGITSNLVSDEQRQRFNYGGRVGYQNRGYVDYTGPSYQPQGKMYPPHQRYLTTWPKSEEDFRTFKKYQFDKIPRWQDVYSDVYETEDKEDIAGLEDIGGLPYLETPKEEEKDIEFKRRMDERSENIRKMQDVGIVIPGEGATTAQEFGTSGVEEEVVVGEEEPSWAGIPGEGGPSAASTITKTDTDLLDTPDKWAFLDEYEAKKKKQSRGQAAWEGAAGAARWSTAGTAKDRSKAIADTLSKVGGIGAKYTGEAMDLRAKAKILGAIEEEKQKGKIDVQTMKETGLGERHKNLIAHYKSLQDDPDKTQFDIYKTLIQTQEGTTGVRMGKVLRAMAEGKRPVADAFDFTNEEQLKKIKDGTIVVSLEGVTGIKDSSEEDGIKEVGIEEILESLR